MREAKLNATLLLADDDPDDRLLVKDALEECGPERLAVSRFDLVGSKDAQEKWARGT